MSKIAIKSSSSGTATFTIESPSTNTDRTLVLPDGSGALYNQSNIVGTVSQSGGVPTGAVIESGSNANGEFVKYADGTMIAGRTIGQNGQASGTFTFPVAFIAAPHVSNSGCRTVEGGVGEGIGVILPNGNFPVSTTGYNWSFNRLAGFGNLARFFSQTAFGRWF